jgi:alanine racemase
MTGTGPAATFRGRITVDLKALSDNWKSLQTLVGAAECGAVVKADAYGLGATAVVPTLASAGCKTFFVATLQEAELVRALAPSATLYVLDGLLQGSCEAMAALSAQPILSDLAQLDEWRSFCTSAGHLHPAALQVDTGLNRLGLSQDELSKLDQDDSALTGLDISLIMSHLASADDPAAAKNEAQRQCFIEALNGLPKAPASLAASDGLMLGPDYHFDLVRPGYALYGGQAFQGGTTPVTQVVTVTARVLQMRRLVTGETVGYSEDFVAKRDTTIAIVAAGYADGVPRHASSRKTERHGHVAIGGKTAPIAGRVSMDLIAVDVTDLSPDTVTRGTIVELIGPSITLEQAGTQAGTIGYELLTRLSRRFERVYSSDAATPQTV